MKQFFLKPVKTAALVMATAILFWGSNLTQAQAQDYVLQPGDTVLAEITQLQGLNWTSMVNFDGYVRFPYLGQFKGEGLTLDELSQEIALASVGKQISIKEGSTVTTYFLDENSIFLGISNYRPVTILGAVTTPGRIDFTPDLTVRAALGAAGGIAVLQSQQEEPRPERAAALSARLNELGQTQAWLMMDAWRLQGQMDSAFQDSPPEDYADVIEALMDPVDIQDVRDRIVDSAVQAEREKQDLADRIKINQNRVEFLEKSIKQYRVLLESEEERLTAMLTLKDRGLASSNTINDARAGTLSVSSRVLDTEAELSQAHLALRSLMQQQESFEADHRLELKAEQARILRSLDEVKERISGLQQELSLVTGAQFISNSESPMSIQIVIHRKTQDGMARLPVDQDDRVFPGDVIEVKFVFSG